jgi:hypothetical protein
MAIADAAAWSTKEGGDSRGGAIADTAAWSAKEGGDLKSMGTVDDGKAVAFMISASDSSALANNE